MCRPTRPHSDDDDMTGHPFRWRRDLAAVLVEHLPQARISLNRALERRHDPEHQRIQGDRDDRARQDQRILRRIDETQRHASLADDERELADLAAARADQERGAHRLGEQHRDERRDDAFADDDHQCDDGDLIPVVEQVSGIDEHADRHEEDHREGFLKRHEIRADLLAERRFADDDAGDERAERERHAEDRRRRQRRAHGHRQHDEHEELARAHAHDAAEDGRHHPAADEQHQQHEEHGLADRKRGDDPGGPRGRGGDDGQQDEDRDGQQIFEHQPADGDLAVRGFEPPGVHQRAQQHDRAGDRQRDAQQPRAADGPSPQPAEPEARQRDDDHLEQRARHGDLPHLPEVLEGEVQADAEHQHDHAELGELTDGVRIALEAGGERPEGHAGDEIADDGRQSDAPGEQAADQRVRQDNPDVQKERNVRQGGKDRSIAR